MLDIAFDFGRLHGGIVPGAVAMGRALMQDDPATFKSGYGFASALSTVAEAFELIEDQRREVRDRMGDHLSAGDASRHDQPSSDHHDRSSHPARGGSGVHGGDCH